MEQKEALEYISKRISQGSSKAALYKELLPKIRYKEWLLGYLIIFADYESQKKVSKRNYLLLSLSTVLIIIHLLVLFLTMTTFPIKSAMGYAIFNWPFFIPPIVLIFLLKNIIRYREDGYKFTIASAFFSITGVMGLSDNFITLRILFMIPWLMVIYLCLSILKKAFPYAHFFKRANLDTFEAELLMELNSKE